MIFHLATFLAILNPFALFLYLEPIMDDLSDKHFLYVLLKASLISFVIYCIFAITGNFVFENIFHICYEAFQIFGGIVVFSFAYLFIIRGHKAFIMVKENLDDLASEIALPFMVGGASISLAIVMGRELTHISSVLVLFLVMAINFVMIFILKRMRDKLKLKRWKIAFDKNMRILLRLNGFFVGAVGVDMIIKGINALYI